MLTRRRLLQTAGASAAFAALPGFRKGNFLPTPDPIAIANGYTKLKWYLNFKNLDDIDLGDTKLPGYKLYQQHGWPNATWNVWHSFGTGVFPPSSSYSQLTSPNAMRMSNPSNGGAPFLMSAIPNGPGSFIGTAFSMTPDGGGWYRKTRFRSDPSVVGTFFGAAQWPSIYMNGVNFLTGDTAPNIELDGIEYLMASPTQVNPAQTVHENVFTCPCPTSTVSDLANGTNNSLAITLDNNYHDVATVWRPQGWQGDTNGSFTPAWDGSLLTGNRVSYNSGTTPTPAFTSRVGALSQADNVNYKFVILFDTTTTWALDIQSDELWQSQ